MSDHMYTCREMAKQMDMTMAQLRQARLDGVGPGFVRVKGQVRYPLSAFHAWLDAGRWTA